MNDRNSCMSSLRAQSPTHHRIRSLIQHMNSSLSPEPSSGSSSLVQQQSTAASLSAPPPSSDGLVVRRLQLSDYDNGFLSLMAELTDVGDISREMFSARMEELSRRADSQTVWVMEDTTAVGGGRIVASATLLIELKFIHRISKTGHIEDVVVSSAYRGRALGHRLLRHVLTVCRQLGCYKVSLFCDDGNMGFYQKLGFKKHENNMAVYFEKIGAGAKDSG